MSTTSPNMNLIVPTTGNTPGPEYADQINSSLTLIDQHTHAAGSGVPITPSAMNISSDLTFNSNNAVDLRSVRFTPQVAAISLPADLGCLYESGVDLYYNDGAGNQIRLTQGGSIVGTAGSITGLPSGTASASYAAGTFVWQSATSTSAVMDFGSAILRNDTANSKGLTLNPPNAMTADYALFLPNLPASQKIMTLDASGNMSAPYTVDGSTIAVVSNVIGIPDGAITGTQIQTSVTLDGNPVIVGKSATAGGAALVVANYTAFQSLAIAGIRALGDGGTVSSGGGITYSQPVTGIYNCVLSTPFTSVPVVTVTCEQTLSYVATVSNIIGSGFTVTIFNSQSQTLVSSPFNVIAIGIQS